MAKKFQSSNLYNLENTDMNNVLNNQNTYSFVALLLIIIGEAFALFGIQGYLPDWDIYFVSVAVLILILWIIGFVHGRRYEIRSVILTKLLANAIAPRWLGVIYLFIFVIHIGWLTNATMSLFMPSSNFRDAVLSTGICIAGMVVTIMFFPNGPEKKDDDAQEVLISGLSEIKLPNVYENLNIRPLVRILQEHNPENCEFLILRSNYGNIKDAELSNRIEEVLRFVLNADTTGEPSVCDRLIGLSVNKKLEVLIKEVAKREFPEKTTAIDKMEFDWTEPCDYNKFRSCHDALSRKIKEKDDAHHRLVCYVSPGTTLVSSLITLMAIDGNRSLYYYSQDRSVPDSKKLMKVEKNEIPLKNLLSQALDTML